MTLISEKNTPLIPPEDIVFHGVLTVLFVCLVRILFLPISDRQFENGYHTKRVKTGNG
jgi:hypothetical protein